jgi:hypothetical protein
MNDSAATVEQPYLTVKELALRWKTSPNAIRIARHRRRAPEGFLRGGKVLFELAAVEAFEAELKAADSRHNTELDPTKKPVEMRGQRRRPAA